MPSEIVAIYPGSFDPLTNGHIDIIQRGSRLFDRIVVGVLINLEKAPLFTVPERIDIARTVFRGRANVEVDTFDGLLVDYARRKEATAIVRGLRAISDFEYEMQMALMNRRLNPEVETVFMMPKEEYSYLSSRLVKEVARFGGDLQGLVPEAVASLPPRGSLAAYLVPVEAAVTRQIALPTSSATSTPPPASTATPTGRPRALPSSPTNPSSTVSGGPEGRPFENGTNTTL